MRLRRNLVTLTLAFATICGTFLPQTRAQQAPSDVAVVSIAPLDRTLKDISYLLKATNFPEMGGLVSIMANQYTQGLDRTKPIGAKVSIAGGVPMALIFVPMTDRDQFFGALAGMGVEPDDLGDGLFEIDTGNQTVFAKDSNGWMFIAQTEDALSNVPADPAAALGSLPQSYDLAIRIDATQIPQMYKDQALEQIRIGYERGMAEQAGQSPEEAAAAKEMGEASIAQLEQMLTDTAEILIAWSVSSDERRTFLDSGVRFAADSKLAKAVNASYGLKSDYKEFKLPGSVANFRVTSTIQESDKAVTKNSLRNSIKQVQAQLEQSDLPAEAQTALSEVIDGLVKITEQTIDEGTFDGGASVSVADDTLRIIAGGYIADGNALAAEVKKAAAQVPESPNAPKFEFDYETYKGVTLHRISGPIKIADPAAKQIFGEELVVTVGTADKSYLIALDPTGDSIVKSVIDTMQSSAGQEATPMEGVIRFTDILKYAQAISPNSILDNAVATMSSYPGTDKLELTTKIIENGAIYRVSIDEGVLKTIGVAAKSGAGGGGGF